MNPENDAIAALREAIKVSPNNLPLREHLAQTLLGQGRPDEAEVEFRGAIGLSPDNPKLKAGLARAFAQQGKNSQAMAVLETLIKLDNCPATNAELAARHYKKAVAAAPELADPDFASELGAGAAATANASAKAAPEDPVEKAPILYAPDEPTTLDSDVERPRVNFSNVGGMESVKDEIRMKIIHPLAHPDLYAAYGKKIGGGILMFGPPGCGKTHLARATAGEIKAAFIAVGINDVLDMWVGSSEKNLHELFDQARRHTPCVLFFDEVDALAASRADMRHQGGRHLINQFLSEMDGINANNDGVLILAATNAPWHVDSAFRRPGRFDRILFVPPPDAPARAGILRILTAGKPVKDIDYDQIAKKCEGFSGADLKAVVDVAIEAKLKIAMKQMSGIAPLLTKDLLSAVASIKPSTREWLATAKNYAMYSNQGGVYDDILNYFKRP